jgi:hypothetical protein
MKTKVANLSDNNQIHVSSQEMSTILQPGHEVKFEGPVRVNKLYQGPATVEIDGNTINL